MTADTDTSRRGFLTTSALAGGAFAASTAGLFADQNTALKVGLIGCGGRGTGAAVNTLKADSNVKLVAMADMYEDQLQASLKQLQKNREIGMKVDVKPGMLFHGFDAYKKVIDASDVVLLTTPPHFRPMHLKAAVEAGKHVFAEKPLAVDAPGVRSVIESVAKAKDKKLGLLVGFCYRWDLAKRETVKRIHDGAIGDVKVIHCNYITGELWHKPIDKPFDTMEYQMKNWYYFNWLSGDHIVEQHCHNHDKAAWVLNGEYPILAYGIGGRQKRTDPKWGNIFDHHSVVYEYRSGAKVFSLCRQMSGATRLMNDVSDHVIGTKGSSQLMAHTITAGGKTWGYDGPEPPSMYDQEHVEFYAGLRAGEPVNNGLEGAHSTLMSIMGRMATYTGMKITAEMALNSKEDLSPPSYEWGPLKYAPVPVPGVTKFI